MFPLVPLLPDGSEATAPVHPIFCSCSCCPFIIFILINWDSLSLILSISEESWSVQKRHVSLMAEDGSMNIIKARGKGKVQEMLPELSAKCARKNINKTSKEMCTDNYQQNKQVKPSPALEVGSHERQKWLNRAKTGG